MPISRLVSTAAMVSLLAVVVAIVLSRLAGVPEEALVIGTIVVASIVGWRLTDQPVTPHHS